MIRNIVEQIGGIGIYGLITLVLFFAVFAGMLIWAFSLKKTYVAKMSSLPLDDSTISNRGGNDHE